MSTTIAEKPKTCRQKLEPRPRVVLHPVSWATYLQLSNETTDHSHVRMIYDQGRLEIVSPWPPHERYKYVLGRFVDNVLLGLRIPFEAAGQSRWIREAAARGLEADETYFISFEKMEIVGGRPAGRPDDPLPDLAIEVDTSDHAADRMKVYAALGIPELWTYDGDELRIFHLQANSTYEQAAASRFLPISSQDIEEWVEKADGVNLLDWIESLQVWIREELVLRRRVVG
jgi:Uma2 family endonuclease